LSRSLYSPVLIARVHAAIAWSPEVLAHVSKSSAAAGVAANQTVDVKARAASVPRRIGVIGMSLWTITSTVDHIATARSRHSYLRAAPYLLMRWSATLMPDQPSRLIAHPEAWLFRIAHNAALDFLRHRARQDAAHADEDQDMIVDPLAVADDRQVTAASLRTFMRLPVAQRGSVILMDVLGYSLEEIGSVMDVSIAS